MKMDKTKTQVKLAGSPSAPRRPSKAYVDDIVLTASSPRLIDRITAFLRSEFAMTDMGSC